MTEEIFEVLRTAVRIARDENVQKLVALKIRLLELFPGRQEDITAAIRFWSGYVQTNRHNF